MHMAAQLSCSFASHSSSTCNFSTRFPGRNEFFPLSSCNKDIKSYLRQLKVAQTSVVSEKDLILARVGMFDLEGNDMTVCPKHRAALGTWWRQNIKSYYLLHGNKRRKPERGASLQICKEIMSKWKVLVPVGAEFANLLLAGINAVPVDGCQNYRVVSEADRLSKSNRKCRRKDLVTGWYRLKGPAGDRIADKCVLKGRCGNDFSGWFKQPHPTVTEGVVTRKVCFSGKKFCCVGRHSIKVKNCTSYYVYKLSRFVLCKILRSCGNGSEETIETRVTESIYELGRLDARQNDSLQEALGLFHNITKLYRNIDSDDFQERKESIFKTAESFEGFLLNFSRHHLSESTPKINVVSNSLALAIQRSHRDFFLEDPGRQASIKVSSANFYKNDTVLVGIVYKDLHELLGTSYSNNHGHDISRRLNTIIVAVTMDAKPDKLKDDISLNFRHLEQVAGGERLCVFWSGFDKSPDGWSRKGCHAVKSTSDAEETECSCNHMTHFAVLFHYSDGNSKLTKADKKILRILTYVGIALSITGVTLTIISYALVTDVHQPLSQIRISLAGSLGAGQIIFLTGIGATDNTGACVTAAALLQYFLMAAFCWMFVEGIYLYLLVVKVYNIENKMRLYHLMSWGFPVIVVTVSLSIAAGNDGIHSFVDDEYCWMSSNNNLIWIFVAIVVVIEILNLLILVRVIKEMSTMHPTAGEKHNHQIRLGIRACLVMSPVLGITWLFGLLMPLHKAFVYIFTVLNSTQGFLIFVFHCVKNSQFRERFKRKLNVIFPTGSDANLTRKTSKVNASDVGAVRVNEVQPCSGVFELKEL